MPSILESLTSVLGQGETFAKLGSLMNGSAEEAAEGVAAAGPALLGALAENASTDEGAQPVADLVDSVGPSILDDVDGLLDDEDTELGTRVLDALFGDDRSELLGGLSSEGSIQSSSYAGLLPRLAPLVLGAVAKRKVDDDLDAASLATALTEERTTLESEGDLGDWFGRTLAGGGAIAAFAGLTAMAKDRLGDAAETVGDVAGGAGDLVGDAAEAVGDAMEDAAEKVGELAGGVVGKIGDAIGSITGRDDDGDTDATGGSGDESGDATDTAAGSVATGSGDDSGDGAAEDNGADTAAALAGGAATAQGLVDSASSATDDAASAGSGASAADAEGTAAAEVLVNASADDDEDRSRGIGWFWWAAGALVLVLILAALLQQFGSSDEADGADDDSGVVAGDGAGSGVADDADDSEDIDTDDDSAGDDGGDGAPSDGELVAGVEAALADAGFGDSVSVSVVDGVVTLSGAVGSAADVEAVEAAVGAVDGIAQMINDVQVDDGDGAPSDGELVAGVEAALADAGFGDSVSVSVVDGVVTLSGAVGSAADVDAVEAAVSTVDGVGQVVNDVLVEAAPLAAAGTSLNEELGLATITFEYRSATITAAGEAVLSEVVGYLEANAVDLTIQGHTDNDGTEAENRALGQRRADSVKAFLEDAGIDGARLEPVGIGETEPKVANDTLDGKATNRRIEFIVAG